MNPATTLYTKHNEYALKLAYLSQFGIEVKHCLVNVTRPVGTENVKKKKKQE